MAIPNLSLSQEENMKCNIHVNIAITILFSIFHQILIDLASFESSLRWYDQECQIWSPRKMHHRENSKLFLPSPSFNCVWVCNRHIRHRPLRRILIAWHVRRLKRLCKNHCSHSQPNLEFRITCGENWFNRWGKRLPRYCRTSKFIRIKIADRLGKNTALVPLTNNVSFCNRVTLCML
jgi:hypothetical protein